MSFYIFIRFPLNIVWYQPQEAFLDSYERRAGLSTYFAKSRNDWRGSAADIQFPELLSDKMDESTRCQKKSHQVNPSH